MKVLRLSVSNFKGVKAVEIVPEPGKPITIAGRNEVGKSSILDAVKCGLQGKRYHPDEPIRHGEKRATVEFELGDDLVEVSGVRTFTPGGQRIELKHRDGLVDHGTDQNYLDKILDARCFDPWGFPNLSDKEQVQVLSEMLQLDFTPLDEERGKIFDTRTELNREIKVLEGVLSSIPKVEPVERIPVGPIQAEIAAVDEVTQHNTAEAAKVQPLKTAFDRIVADGVALNDNIERIGEELAKLKLQLEADAAALIEAKIQAVQAREVLEAQQARVAELVTPDVSGLMLKLEAAQSVNAQADSFAARGDKEASIVFKYGVVEDLTKDIEAIDAQKAQTIAEAKMPIAGLSFTEECVRFEDVPLRQVNTEAQLRVGAAIGMCLKPLCRVMLIHQGSAMDAEHEAMFYRIAEEYDCQVWFEKIRPDAESIVIEAGEVASPERAEEIRKEMSCSIESEW